MLFILCRERSHDWISRRFAPDSMMFIIMNLRHNRTAVVFAYGYFSSLCLEVKHPVKMHFGTELDWEGQPSIVLMFYFREDISLQDSQPVHLNG